MTPSTPGAAARIGSVDVLRGLVILCLVPDLTGGFSFHVMAERDPGNAVWQALASQFTHVEWRGMALWDLVMPAFVLLVGVSIALSVDRRRALGDAPLRVGLHALLRSLSLVVLGLLLPMRRESVAQEVVPYVLLAAALPWDRWLGAGRAEGRVRRLGLEYGLPLAALAASALWIATHPHLLGAYDLNQILTQLGLAYLPAVVLAGRGIARPLVAAAAVLTVWGLAFVLYAPPAGLAPTGDVMSGIAGHWNNGTNLAAAFDRWWLNLLPRTQPYVGNAHGYHTLQFVPLVANMLVGVAVGRVLTDRSRATGRLLLGGAAMLTAGGMLVALGIPLVKSLWTPSWAMVSGAVCVGALALLHVLVDGSEARWTRPVVVLGSNTILLYVIASVHRWRIVLYSERLLGDAMTHSPWRPLWQSLAVLGVLWIVAWVLDRLRVHVRL